MERLTTLVMSLTNFCDTIYVAITTYASDLNVVFVGLDLLDAQQRRLEEGLRCRHNIRSHQYRLWKDAQLSIPSN